MSFKRLLPLSGIVFVALVVIPITLLGGATPGGDASAAEVASFYGDNVVREALATFVFAASVPFLVLFAVSLAGATGSREGGRNVVWERVLVGGGLITASALLVASLIHFALLDGADQGVSPTALQALNALDNNTWIAWTSGLGVMMLGAAGCLIPQAGSYRRLGWAALVFGVALFIPWANWIALLLTLLWFLVASVVQLRGGGAPRYAVAPRPA